jgi:hypothetical protein
MDSNQLVCRVGRPRTAHTHLQDFSGEASPCRARRIRSGDLAGRPQCLRNTPRNVHFPSLFKRGAGGELAPHEGHFSTDSSSTCLIEDSEAGRASLAKRRGAPLMAPLLYPRPVVLLQSAGVRHEATTGLVPHRVHYLPRIDRNLPEVLRILDKSCFCCACPTIHVVGREEGALTRPLPTRVPDRDHSSGAFRSR